MIKQKEKCSRADKVAGEIKKVISECLVKGEVGSYEDIDPAMIVVTDVIVSPCLRHAKIFISSVASYDDNERYLQFLDSHIFQLRRLIASNVKLKFVPEIRFLEDNSSVYANRIESLLKTL